MRYLILTLLFFSLVSVAAGVFMSTDQNGNISYSDAPSPNAKQVDVPAPSVIQTAPAVTPAAPATANEKNAKPEKVLGPTQHQPYTSFTIMSPEDQQTFQNQRNIPVEVSMQPRLQQNDSVQLYVDGQKYRDPWPSQHLAIYQLDRGTHTVYAELLDSRGVVLNTSNTVTIFIHYAALGPSGVGMPAGGGGAPP